MRTGKGCHGRSANIAGHGTLGILAVDGMKGTKTCRNRLIPRGRTELRAGRAVRAVLAAPAAYELHDNL